MTAWARSGDGGVLLEILVTPRAKRSKVIGLHGDRLKVALAAPPVDGKANEELIRVIAEIVGVPKSAVEIRRGGSGREKSLYVRGIELGAAVAALDARLCGD